MAHSDLRAPRRPARRARAAVLGALVLALPLATACNALIGLSDFEKGQCAGARCADDGGRPDQLVEGAADGADDGGADAKGADPVSWAKWPMPNYGEAGPGMPIPSPPLVAGSGGIVTDPTTKLVWRSTLVPSDFSATEAQGECETLPDGPWRAPKRIELVTLLDYSRPSPFVDRSKFTDLLNYRVWSTSEVRPFVSGKPDQAYWVVNFETGAVEPLAGDLRAKVLCVRAK